MCSVTLGPPLKILQGPETGNVNARRTDLVKLWEPHTVTDMLPVAVLTSPRRVAFKSGLPYSIRTDGGIAHT